MRSHPLKPTEVHAHKLCGSILKLSQPWRFRTKTWSNSGLNFDLLQNASSDHRQIRYYIQRGALSENATVSFADAASEKGGGLSATLFEELMERDGGGLGSSYGPFSGDDDKAELLRTAREALSSEGETDGNR
jgi:hypothetical protein